MRAFLSAALFSCAIPLQATAAVNVTPCPSGDFKKFIEVFSVNAQVQQAYTVTPLRYDHLDADAEPEPKVVSEIVKQPKASYYQLLTKAIMAERRFKPTAKVLSPQRAVLELYEYDTDFQITYYFRKAAGCWKLEKIADHSL